MQLHSSQCMRRWTRSVFSPVALGHCASEETRAPPAAEWRSGRSSAPSSSSSMFNFRIWPMRLFLVMLYRWLNGFVNDDISPNSTWHVTSRLDTASYLAHAFWHSEKSWRDVSRLSDSTARHARHNACDTHDTSYVSCRVLSRRDVTNQVEFGI